MLWQLAQACSRLYIDHVCTKVGSKAVDGFLQQGVAGGAKIRPKLLVNYKKIGAKPSCDGRPMLPKGRTLNFSSLCISCESEFSNRVSAKGKRFTSRFLTQLKS